MTASYNLSLLGSNYNQGGTGAVARTTASKLQESVSVKDFGAVGDGTTDDTTAIQNAINAAYGLTLRVPKGTYLCTSTINVTQGLTIEGDGSLLTVIKFNVGVGNNGIVFASSSFGNNGHGDFNVSKIAFEGASFGDAGLTYCQDVVYINIAYRCTFNDVQAHGAARNALRLNQCLHTQFRDCRFEDALQESVNVLDGTNTTVVFDSCYIRYSGMSGLKTNCLGITIRSCIFEACGVIARTSVYTYYPAIWINGGTAYIHDMYTEANSGHNIFCDAGITYVNVGQNTSGAGTNNSLYANLFAQGSAWVFLAGAGYGLGGGNKKQVKISSASTGLIFGETFTVHTCTAVSLVSPTNYTSCTYDVANLAAINAIVSPVAAQTAHAQDTGYEYKYSGSAWVLTNANQFIGRIVSYDPPTGRNYTYGKLACCNFGDSTVAIANVFTQIFNANASADNVVQMQSGAVIAANSQVAVTKAMNPVIAGYGAISTSSNFIAQFNTAQLAAGLDVRANILNAGQVQVVVYNFTTAAVTLTTDILGRILVSHYVDL